MLWKMFTYFKNKRKNKLEQDLWYLLLQYYALWIKNMKSIYFKLHFTLIDKLFFLIIVLPPMLSALNPLSLCWQNRTILSSLQITQLSVLSNLSESGLDSGWGSKCRRKHCRRTPVLWSRYTAILDDWGSGNENLNIIVAETTIVFIRI